MSAINHAVHHEHASSNIVYHALHGYYYGGRSIQELAASYSKSERTVRNWICIFEKNKVYQRLNKSRSVRFRMSVDEAEGSDVECTTTYDERHLHCLEVKK